MFGSLPRSTRRCRDGSRSHWRGRLPAFGEIEPHACWTACPSRKTVASPIPDAVAPSVSPKAVSSVTSTSITTAATAKAVTASTITTKAVTSAIPSAITSEAVAIAEAVIVAEASAPATSASAPITCFVPSATCTLPNTVPIDAIRKPISGATITPSCSSFGAPAARPVSTRVFVIASRAVGTISPVSRGKPGTC